MKNREDGFTLIEQIIVIASVGVLLPGLAGFFFQAFLGPVQNSAQLAAAGDIQLTSDWIARDLAGGPMGNNLGLSEFSPSSASVTIGSSPGYPGDNSLTITYHTWPALTSTIPEDHSITYGLEKMDPASDELQLVRRDDDGSVVVVAKHIVDPSHVVFSGSAQSSPGGVSDGITLSITSTLEGPIRTVTRQANLVFTLPRSYQPTPVPAPSSQTWSIAMPYWLSGKTGYWEVIETKGTGNISANWQLISPADIQVWVYQGEPMGRPSGNSTITPTKVNALVLATVSGVSNLLTVTTSASQPAGNYTVYFFNGDRDYTNTVSATVTYVSP